VAGGHRFTNLIGQSGHFQQPGRRRARVMAARGGVENPYWLEKRIGSRRSLRVENCSNDTGTGAEAKIRPFICITAHAHVGVERY
jgi:hypothetical protein